MGSDRDFTLFSANDRIWRIAAATTHVAELQLSTEAVMNVRQILTILMQRAAHTPSRLSLLALRADFAGRGGEPSESSSISRTSM